MADKLITIFSEVLVVNASVLNDESSPDTLEEWDSLGAMNLVTAIEEKFDVQLSTKEIMKMVTIGLVRKFLQDKGIEI